MGIYFLNHILIIYYIFNDTIIYLKEIKNMKRKFLIDDEINNTLLMEIFVTDSQNPVAKKQYQSSIMTIEVRTKEGYNVPHIHFIKSDGSKGCIQIAVAGYFIHPGYPATLNNTEAKILDTWMGRLYPSDYNTPPRTNWRFIRDFWNEKEPEHKIITKKKPDYTKLNDTGIRR